jgi:hypothetical protein
MLKSTINNPKAKSWLTKSFNFVSGSSIASECLKGFQEKKCSSGTSTPA